jgi:hypothetical protein
MTLINRKNLKIVAPLNFHGSLNEKWRNNRPTKGNQVFKIAVVLHNFRGQFRAMQINS